MSKETQVKTEALPDLDDLLQCPVCYEIPSGQIFQCNEGHHVCGRCKTRLDVCPVCRALFFGTRNYAMEELIANIRRLRAFKLGGKITTGSTSSESNSATKDDSIEENDNNNEEDEENIHNFASRPVSRAPQACKGVFRCLCCKITKGERFPLGRLLNHLRYFHAPDLIEGQSENGEYLQAWQFSTMPGRLVTAVRVTDMGIFFLIIEIKNDAICAWLTMAASPWVAHEFCYTVTISGNDREAIFSDCVWSVRSCEGSLRKRGHCLVVNGVDARALVSPSTISGKLSVRRVPVDQLAHQTQPRAVMRVASRGNANDNTRPVVAHDLEPFLQDLQNDVARLSRAFATLGREANALVRSEAEMRQRIETQSNRTTSGSNAARRVTTARNAPPAVTPPVEPPASPPTPPTQPAAANNQPMSRTARRRMRQRVMVALNAPQPPQERNPAQAQSNNVQPSSGPRQNGTPAPPSGAPSHHQTVFSGFAVVQQAPSPPPQPAQTQPSAAPSTQNGNQQPRANKKKRRQRR